MKSWTISDVEGETAAPFLASRRISLDGVERLVIGPSFVLSTQFGSSKG
jgi:hypothetical protein